MSGQFLDPTIVPTTPRQRAVLAAIVESGLSLYRVHADREAVHLVGPGVSVLAAGLGGLAIADLQPATGANSQDRYQRD